MLRLGFELPEPKVVVPGFQWAPTLGGECYQCGACGTSTKTSMVFQWAPTLGGECYSRITSAAAGTTRKSRFNGHPPLGVNATTMEELGRLLYPENGFNGHPPLGVNATGGARRQLRSLARGFNGHPSLGVNATPLIERSPMKILLSCFNGHPPLGVNATTRYASYPNGCWIRFNGHPPLGVNATNLRLSISS